MMQKRLGIFGCGAIGSEIVLAVSGGQIEGYVLAGLCDVDEEQARRLQSILDAETELMELAALISASDVVF